MNFLNYLYRMFKTSKVYVTFFQKFLAKNNKKVICSFTGLFFYHYIILTKIDVLEKTGI